jgi:hypothetical protein
MGRGIRSAGIGGHRPVGVRVPRDRNTICSLANGRTTQPGGLADRSSARLAHGVAVTATFTQQALLGSEAVWLQAETGTIEFTPKLKVNSGVTKQRHKE